MKILVTGCAGFIASRVVEVLLEQGHTVVGIDNLNEAYDVRLKQWRLRALADRPNFHFQRLDITDRPALFGLASQLASSRGSSAAAFDAVINLAARAGVRQSVIDPAAYVETNLLGTLNLLDLCRESGARKFILASSSSLYGSKNPGPFREDANTDLPLSPYAASKKAAEVMVHSYHHLYGIDATIFRYFTVYGPGGRPDMSPFRFVQWISEGRPVTIYGDGTQLRDFTYVDDIARGTIAGLAPLGFEIINLGSDRPMRMNDVIAAIERLTGAQAKIVYAEAHPSDVAATWANIEKAARLLHWKPQVEFATGVANLVRWYNANRDWAKDIATT